MIPEAAITHWRNIVPWQQEAQIEQDLIMSRAIVEIFSGSDPTHLFAMRGGTVFHKLILGRPLRYSEDIDLVQTQSGPIGPAINRIREQLDPWLGSPKWKQKHGSFTLIYRFSAELPPATPLRLKIEINTREHFTMFGFQEKRLAIQNPWFTGETEVVTYAAEEILGTKLRALYQRKKGRDLFDLAVGTEQLPSLDRKGVVECFQRYMTHVQAPVSRAEFEANLVRKLNDPVFAADINPLLLPGTKFDIESQWKQVHSAFITQLPGDSWKGNETR